MEEELKKYSCLDCGHICLTTIDEGCKKCKSNNLEIFDKSLEKSKKGKFDLVDWIILLAIGLFFGSGIGFFINSVLAEIFHNSLKPSEFPLQWLIIGGVVVLFTLGFIYFFGPKKITNKSVEKSIILSKELTKKKFKMILQ